MSRQRLRHFALVFVLALASLTPATGARAASAAPAAPVSSMLDTGPPVMREAADYVAHAPVPHFAAQASESTITRTVNNPRLYREVFGFAYASSLHDPDIGYQSWNMDLLSTVAYFGVHVDAWSGVLVSDSGLYIWNNPSSAVPALIRTAHAHGVKVILTLIMFDSDPGTPSMCAALQFSDATVKAAVDQVKAKGIDGINVDYEAKNSTCYNRRTGAPESSQSLFTNFIRNLRAALPAGSYLSVDTYTGSAAARSGTTYTGFFDISALAPYVDSFFVMAYDMEYYNWGSPPLNCAKFCLSPTAPLSGYLYNDQRVSAEYRAVVPASKVLLGIPYYGRKGCVAGTPSSAVPNAVATSVAADGYLDASTENGFSGNSDYHIHRDAKDPAGSVRWDTFTSSSANCTRELYWDDVTSLGYKYNLVIRDKLRGIGIWTLSYGGGAPELWSLINHKFGKCADATLVADHTSPQIPGTSITFTGDAFCAGTPQYRFWSQPAGGPWTIAQDYSTTNTVSWDTTGKALGTYNFEVDARNLGSSVAYDTVARMPLRLARCVTPALTADHSSPLLPGTVVTFNVSVTCQGAPEYRFWVRGPTGVWSIAQNYGPSSTFVWNTAAHPYGNYSIEVDARVQGTSVSYESVTALRYSLTSCINTGLSTDKASPQPTGGTVMLSATATCTGANQYRFWVRAPGAAWRIVRDYSSAATFAWTPGGPGGDYALEVDAKSAGASASTIVPANQAFTITVCTASTLTTDVAQPQLPGTRITLTGGATCDGPPQYRFWMKSPGGGWGIVQDYGPSSTYTWDTTGKPIGFYGLEVDVRNTGATSSYETTVNKEYALANEACATPTLTPSLSSPQGTGVQITLTATTTACPNPIYRFWIQPPGGAWTSVRSYTSSPTFTWNASGAGGTYGLEVDVRDVSRSSLAYDAVANITFALVACSAAALTTDVTSPQPSGTVVTVTGAATCAGIPEYRFWVRPPGGSWTIVRDYAVSSTFAWDTASRAAGTYDLEVDVRDQGATATYETVASKSFTLT
jgi:spore germination protein YaaH